MLAYHTITLTPKYLQTPFCTRMRTYVLADCLPYGRNMVTKRIRIWLPVADIELKKIDGEDNES